MKIFREMKGLPDEDDSDHKSSENVKAEEQPADTQVSDVIYVEPASDEKIAEAAADADAGKNSDHAEEIPQE